MLNEDIAIKDREYAAHLLSEKLLAHKDSNAVIVAIPPGGAVVGYHLSNLLKLPLKIFSCQPIEHPCGNGKTIGSVGEDEIILHEDADIPGDYISYHIGKLQHIAKAENNLFNKCSYVGSLENKTVFIISDALTNPDTIIACLKSIRRQKPFKIIVAVSFVTPEAARVIADKVDEIIFLQMESFVHPHEKFAPVQNDEINLLFGIS